MRPAIRNASARQHSGGPSPVAGRGGNRNERARKPGLSEIEDEIAGLLDRPTPELRHAWREFHRAECNELAAAVFVSLDDFRLLDFLPGPWVVRAQRDPGGLIRSLGLSRIGWLRS